MAVTTLTARGTQNGNARLKNIDVLTIRRLYNQRYEPGKRITMKQLATRFEISLAQVARIITREQWGHL